MLPSPYFPGSAILLLLMGAISICVTFLSYKYFPPQNILDDILDDASKVVFYVIWVHVYSRVVSLLFLNGWVANNPVCAWALQNFALYWALYKYDYSIV